MCGIVRERGSWPAGASSKVLEVEATLRGAKASGSSGPVHPKLVGAGVLVHPGCKVLIQAIVDVEVCLQDLHGLLINVLVLVVLEPLDLVQPLSLIHHVSKHVGGRESLLLHALAHLEDVLKAFQGHSDNAAVIDCEEVAHGLDGALVHEVLDLLMCAPRCGVADGPGGLLLDVKLRGLQEVHQGADEAGVDHGLDLVLGAGSDVGDSPAGLLLDALLVGGLEQRQQAAEHVAVDNHLRLHVIPGDDIPHRAESGHNH
mmetsp:Transcript_20263/g.56182  ORF Transcript_20263/g.56182 Transcript_20263/m.56182 type:complete len:258 (+) Transcript_20263:127-900(+)